MMVKNGYQRKERNSFRRTRRPILFFAAEGKNKTEKLYFRDFGQDVNRMVRFAPGNHTDPVNMVSELKHFLTENDFSPSLGDKAYCLVDADVDPVKNTQIAKAEELAERAGITMVLSAPCFEVWFLCHFIFSMRQYASSAEVVADLRRFISDYEKSTDGMYEKTKTYMATAIENAMKLETFCEKNGYAAHTTEYSPSTDVYQIAKELLT